MPIRAAMILCAGLGTRLRPLTDWLAKPMVPIGDKPAVEHIAARIRETLGERRDFERLVVNVHHRPDDVRSWATRQHERVLVSDESDVLLGTAGGVARAAPLLDDDAKSGDDDAAVLVWNGDILSDLDPRVLVLAHEQAGPDATLAVSHLRAPGEGSVGIGEDGRIVRLRRSTTTTSGAREVSGADFIGIHVLGAAMRRALPAKGCLVADVWIPALLAGHAYLAAHVVTSSSSFTDVGSLGSYVAANRAWLAMRDAPSWTAPEAIVAAGVKIDGSIIGAGAHVEADAIRCIVWPGARITEPTVDAVVSAHGNVKVSSTLSAS